MRIIEKVQFVINRNDCDSKSQTFPKKERNGVFNAHSSTISVWESS